ncbi:MAG: hypothetical protein OEM02_09105, partial [Desulfobulbaceae bacterium]|nr:hypothetical protein [Desulfobulbaceae bacterium]
FTAWLLYCVASLKREPTLKWVAATGLCLGLALSAKASATALVGGTIIALLLPRVQELGMRRGPRLPIKQTFYYLFAMTFILILVGGGWLLSGASALKELPLSYAVLSDNQLILHYLSVFIIWSVVLWFFYKNRTRQPGYGWSLLLVLALATVTFFVIPPVHTTNPAIFAALVDIFLSSTDSFTWLFAGEAATLHFLDLLLKSGIVVGVGFWLSIIAAIFQFIQRGVLRTPVIFFLAYFAFLVLKMPHAQTFFMMPLLPIAAILFADRLLWLFKRSRNIAFLVMVCALLTTTVDLIRTYPYTHLNGYQWVGARYIAGRSTIGYRGVAQTPSDGLEQATIWIRNNVANGQRLLYYMWADHILRAQLKDTKIAYRNGYKPHPVLDQANYVLIHINATLDDGRGKNNPKGSVYKYRFDKEKLERDFRKIYCEKRPFGIEVASVWYRKIPYDIDENGNVIGFKTKEYGLALHKSVE